MNFVFGGIEAGGTKWICAAGLGPGEIQAQARIPTTTPGETIQAAIDFFRQVGESSRLAALGIGSFGPLDPHPQSGTFGYITSTPKPGWANTDVAGPLREALQIPVSFDTDVNAAALGEAQWGAAQGLQDFVYLTIGTGIGGGVMANGKLVHGLLHPEIGHLMVPHDREADPFEGTCPFHGDCLEGLASGPALKARWGQPAEALPPDHPAWDLEARYLSLGLVNLILSLSPRRIVLGGGVMQQGQLFPRVREQVVKTLNGYVQSKQITDEIHDYIVPPGLGTHSGVSGALALARQAFQEQTGAPLPPRDDRENHA
jgi:fructokinase